MTLKQVAIVNLIFVLVGAMILFVIGIVFYKQVTSYKVECPSGYSMLCYENDNCKCVSNSAKLD
jgi:hypothetical protein